MRREAETIWQTAYGHLEVQLPRETFTTWLTEAHFLAHEDGTFIIGVPNTYARDWLNHRLKTLVNEIVSRIAGHTCEVNFTVWQPPVDNEPLAGAGPLLADFDEEPEDEPRFERLPAGETGLNARQTFETFAVGGGNRLAHAAARAVVEAPAAQFNPLYIYGGVGMGKSHRMQAIGNACVNDGLSVLYVPAETFTNDLVASIREKKTAAFRRKYRQVGVLLVDDVSFLAGKTSSMEEFYHTFNDLAIAGAQIVLGSSLQPGDIRRLDPRLRSRFEGGLIVELAQPDFLTRVDILESKVHERGFDDRISLDVLETIAERFDGSIRELEGALNQVIAQALVTPEPPEVAAIERTLDLVKAAPPDVLTLDTILLTVADYFGVSVEAITGRDRSREVSTARQVVMYIAREEGDTPLQQIGDALGGRHHSTVSYSCERIADMMRIDSHIRRQINAILRMLRTGAREKS
ncbi:MAG: chromosomal replication initiator protein DnaA [Chloroflexi bacterium]|nr:chromosomal replication initiator protein DnaA [Chloroflexota bacterium]